MTPLRMDSDGRVDQETQIELVSVLNSLEQRIEFLRGRLPNKLVAKRLKATLKAYEAVQKLVDIDFADPE